ncbi:unnamed protein product, partial [Ectocarpus sp. 8 AP-2014]
CALSCAFSRCNCCGVNRTHTCRVTPGRYILSVPTLYLAFGTAPGSAGCSSCNICIATTNHSECRALFLSA